MVHPEVGFMRNYHAETAASIDALSTRIMQDMSSFYAPYIPETMTKTKYKFSRTWFVADFDTAYYGEVEAWCKEQFGPHPKYPDVWSRWVHTYEDQIHFRDERDYNWFVLRWGA